MSTGNETLTNTNPQPEAATDPAKPETQAEKPTDLPDGGDEGAEHTEESAASDGNDAPARANKGPRKRIDELTWQKHEALRERDAERQRVAELQKQIDALQPKYDSKSGPNIEQFDFDQAAFLAARDRWARDQAIAEYRQGEEKKAQERQQSERDAAFNDRIQAFTATHPGGWEAATSAPINYTEPMLEAIKASDKGPEIAYYLSQNLDEASDISGMTPYAAAAAIVRLETKVATQPAPVQPPKPVTKAPVPPTTLNPGAPIKTDWSQMSPEEHRAALRAKQQARG